MKYRSRIDIMAGILQTAMNGALKTRLMYGASLSYTQLQSYLEFVMEKKLLICENNIYHLSTNGMRFLSLYEEIQEFASITKESPIRNRPVFTEQQLEIAV